MAKIDDISCGVILTLTANEYFTLLELAKLRDEDPERILQELIEQFLCSTKDAK